MKILANIVALTSLIAYCIGIFSKKNGITLICFTIGDFIYALSYCLLKDFLTASSFLLGMIISLVLGYLSIKDKKTPISIYIIFEILEIISFAVFFKSYSEILVLIANVVYVFFACLNYELPFKYSILVFGVLLLVYNLINMFILGIIIESVILITTIIEIIKIKVNSKFEKLKNII